MKPNSLHNSGFSSIEDNISQILKPIFVKKKDNFLLTNSLNKNWQKIIGEKCWQFCSPRKIQFEKNKKANAVLTIAANNSAVAFYLEANISQILENIASYYGYKVVGDIKIIQEPKIILQEKLDKIEEKISKKNEELIVESTNKIKDLELKEILQKLGKSILK